MFFCPPYSQYGIIAFSFHMSVSKLGQFLRLDIFEGKSIFLKTRYPCFTFEWSFMVWFGFCILANAHWPYPISSNEYPLLVCSFLLILIDQGSVLLYSCFFVFVFLGLHPRHMEVSRLGVELELRLPAYTTATAMLDLSCVCNLLHSSQQRRSEARDWTCNLMISSWICATAPQWELL